MFLFLLLSTTTSLECARFLCATFATVLPSVRTLPFARDEWLRFPASYRALCPSEREERRKGLARARGRRMKKVRPPGKKNRTRKKKCVPTKL